MSDSVETREFQAEVKQLLDLMVHSLYSDKDVFLRELVSNASDALDKLRFERLTRPELSHDDELAIRLVPAREARTLSITDNGIGMTREEVIKNIGTIAKSGTKEFLAAARAAQQAAQKSELPPELIGQFGVGFYSAFMVAERIVLVTRRAGEAKATRWESTGDGSYTLSETERDGQGTTITLHLKPADPEHGLRDYTAEGTLREIVKRYSDFVGYPIRMPAKADQDAPAADDTLNSLKAIWDRPKAEVTEQEYKDFYRHVSHDWNEPLRSIPIRLEGTLEAFALLYLPAKAPHDLYNPEMKRGVQLYVKRVFVMDECKELMPMHLRFVRGVVDAHDLSLNVSREILQKDRQIQIIKKQLVKRVLGTLDEMKRDAGEEYRAFWAEFGPVLKEGLASHDVPDKDKLLDLVLAGSTRAPNEQSSLADYVGRMKEGQEAIYFLTGPSRDAVSKSPLLERFVQKGYEVLLFSDPIDEFWLEHAPTFKDKPLKAISRGEIELGTEEERKQESETLDAKQKEFGDLLACLRVHLQEEIKEVRISSRLTASAACLVSEEGDLSPRLERMLEQLGQKPPKAKRILELNPSHVVLGKLRGIYQESQNDPRLKLYAELLLGQAHLAESGNVPDPNAFSRVLAEVMVQGI